VRDSRRTRKTMNKTRNRGVNGKICHIWLLRIDKVNQRLIPSSICLATPSQELTKG
jgi:hypothetical protein